MRGSGLRQGKNTLFSNRKNLMILKAARRVRDVPFIRDCEEKEDYETHQRAGL
jgi:hypothetical protein